MVLRIYVSTEVGDDKNDGLSDQSPVRSARRVIALCRGDNEIVVMGGPEMLRQLSKQVKKEEQRESWEQQRQRRKERRKSRKEERKLEREQERERKRKKNN
jgi:NAD(P)H-flavin reductase